MWVFVTDAYVSIVQDRTDPTGDTLLVRARHRGDIARFLGHRVTVRETPGSDYRFRASVPRTEVAAALTKQCDQVRYDNFKASVRSEGRHFVYMRVWGVLKDWQDRLCGNPEPPAPPPIGWPDYS